MSAEGVPLRPDAWRWTLSGLCASLVCIGLARFAYTPMLPALVDGGWFDASDAAYLGAANLAGYLAGVVSAGGLACRTEPRRLLRLAMGLSAVSFIACAWRLGFAWFFLWRFASGAAGGVAMILAAPTILPHVPPSRRGLVGGAVFMGVGLGIAASGTLVPLLLGGGLPRAWLGLGALAAILTAVAWNGWPDALPTPTARHRARSGRSKAIGFLSATYGLNAFGLVPHMVFLVAFVSRGLGQGLDVGTRYWSVFGLGAIVGPVLLGHLADSIGSRRALRATILAEALFVALPAVSASTVALVASSFVIGAATIGVVPVVLRRSHLLLEHRPAEQPAAWRQATTSFAVMQAAGAYLLTFTFSRTGSYRVLFVVGAAAMLASLGADLLGPADRKAEA